MTRQRGEVGEASLGAAMDGARSSPQARPEAQFPMPGAGAGTSSCRDLVLGGWDWSKGHREVAFRVVRESLEGLEAQLALEDAQLTQQRDELAGAWTRFHAAVEARRQEDLALQAAREEAVRFAKEVREGAIRDADELLAPLQDERNAAADLLAEVKAEREAMEGSLA